MTRYSSFGLSALYSIDRFLYIAAAPLARATPYLLPSKQGVMRTCPQRVVHFFTKGRAKSSICLLHSMVEEGDTMAKNSWSDLVKKEDWWAIWFGLIMICAAVFGIVTRVPNIGGWTTNPLDMFPSGSLFPTLLLFLGLGVMTAIGIRAMGEKALRYFGGFTVVFIIAILAYLFANQAQIKTLGIGYAFWALAIGLLISNTIGTPKWLLAGAKSELFIKTGLVLLGAEILFSKIVELGGPGLFVAWFVTPTVIIFMFLFGTKILKIPSKALVIVIAAATSVCGVSAAIATAAAAKAKKEELTLAVGITLIFTVLMMVFMPIIIKVLGLNAVIGGAWIGGTIDATGAVVAAGNVLGPQAEKVAAVVKMIQNVLIGVVAFVVAIYWSVKVERGPDSPKPNALEIWYRFPKFILGFVGASLLFSFVLVPYFGRQAQQQDQAAFHIVPVAAAQDQGVVDDMEEGSSSQAARTNQPASVEASSQESQAQAAAVAKKAPQKESRMQRGVQIVNANIIKPVTKVLRGWLFCLAFVAIGLESNFRELSSQLAGGKPLILYVTGQSFNLVLTVLAAWLAFGGVLFPPVF